MEIALRRLAELAVHVKIASEAVLAAAHHMTELRSDDRARDDGAWSRAMDEIIALNVQLGFMERILRTTMHDDVAPPRPARGGRVMLP